MTKLTRPSRLRAAKMACFMAFAAFFGHSSVQANPVECSGPRGECETPSGGSYAIRLPTGVDLSQPIPALLYFHGAGGTGSGSMKNTGMVNAFLNRGYAVIAPSGLKRPNSRFGPGWSFLPFRKKQRDERAFAREVLQDVEKRFNVDRQSVLMSGFSIGGSLVWYLACEDPDLAKAYAPVAGAFWRPHPQTSDCKAPVQMFHTHGWRDGTVPLEGRPLGGGRIYQGDVFQGLQILRQLNNCDGLKADKFKTDERFWIRTWTRCTRGSALSLALHPGGHSVPKGWANRAIKWFENLERKTN